MNIDDYVNHIRKKYRLALAVTIIQNKPENITSHEYIETLRKNIENATNTDFDEISINSTDFLYEDDPGLPINKEVNKQIEENGETTPNIQLNDKDIYINRKNPKEISTGDSNSVNFTTTHSYGAETNIPGQEKNGYLDITHGKYIQNDKDIYIKRKSLKGISRENVNFTTTELKEAKTNITGQVINDNLNKTHENYISKVQPTNMLIKHNAASNKTNDLTETRESINSPNILENYNIKLDSINKTSAVKEKIFLNESNIVETHENMNSPNILKDFNIEQAIQAHSIDRNKTGEDKDVLEKKCDSILQKQSHQNDKTNSKARNINSTLTIKNKQQQSKTKHNLIVEDSILNEDSDTDSNITDCDVANNFMDDIIDDINNNNIKLNTHTTFYDHTTQLETIDLINIKEGSRKYGKDRNKGKSNNKAKDSQVCYDLTECNTVNLKEQLHPKNKTKEEFKMIKKGYFIEATIPIKKTEEHNKLKRKLNEASETITDMNMLSQINRVETNEIDSQTTEIYTIHGFSQPLTHISQSQAINTYNIDPKHVQKAKQQKNITKDIEEDVYIQLSPDIGNAEVQNDSTNNIGIVHTDMYTQLSPNIELQDNTIDFEYNDINLIYNESNSESTSKDYDSINLYDNSKLNSYIENSKGLKKETLKTKNSLKEESILIKDNKNIIKDVPKSKLNRIDNETNMVDNCNLVPDKSYTKRINENMVTTENHGPEVFEYPNDNAGVNTEANEITLNEEEVINKNVELIPFKVIEEMNRVKVYLSRNNNRRMSADGFSADSGFLSDSQIKNSLQLSSQCSENWLNQSAHCLLEYLLQCPLLATNMEFVEEIAMVISELIDKLHAEENYPPFLDLILEKIELFLEEICSGYNNELESKIELLIHRFLLLNKSINIIKYTLEKLTKILEKTHENLTKTDPCYEITNINETQMLSYIFHILEILLKRYFKQKDDIGTQNTPKETLTKKTCITDIWRAKWNSKFKSFKELPSREVKEDITERMAVILNKIIINCMEGYSLVSFAALQCFNVLQS